VAFQVVRHLGRAHDVGREAAMWDLGLPLLVGFCVVVGLWWRANRGGTMGTLDVNAKQLAERRKHWGRR
jgi:hypothetical protein